VKGVGGGRFKGKAKDDAGRVLKTFLRVNPKAKQRVRRSSCDHGRMKSQLEQFRQLESEAHSQLEILTEERDNLRSQASLQEKSLHDIQTEIQVGNIISQRILSTVLFFFHALLSTYSTTFLQKLRTLNAELAGNSNTHSKIKYMKQLKEENNKLMSDNRKMAKLLNAQSGKNGQF
jgi:hypothetical protein